MVRALVIAAVTVLLAPAAAGATATVRDGEARFQVISPSLLRLEYAVDGRFEDRPSLNVVKREFRAPRHSVRRTATTLTIRTSRLVLRYERGSGAFNGDNLTVTVAGTTARPRFGPRPAPGAGPPALEVSPYQVADAPGYRAPKTGNLGGWYRGLDLATGPVALHDGVLSRDGWYLLDDSHTALLQDGPPGFAPRPERQGVYQDGWFFGYGQDYARALADLRRIAGAAPLLPRKAFGVWFSRYFNYGQGDYPAILERFRSERIPLDVLMVDTDFKVPHAWNGWSWSPLLFPRPKEFVDWAHREGLEVALNTHPSITSDDPHFAAAQARAGDALPSDPTGIRCRAMVAVGDVYGVGTPGITPDCKVFDWTRAGDQDAYFSLHAPFEADGIDFWWLDYCCDESYAIAPGLTQDTWINELYARRNRARGSRWPLLSRIGASVFGPDEAGTAVWAEHRNAIHFTGDARPTWEMLDFQSGFAQAEGAIGVPYVSHDIGGFGAVTSDGTAGRHLEDALYVRWVQSGTFGPLLRLHSDHGDRLPWDYPGKAQEVATRFLALRGELLPYLYTLARDAHARGLPMTRPMYLRWPALDDAYGRDRQFMLGTSLLVAPVGTAGDPATKEVWFPPGTWHDVFTGERHTGPKVQTLTVPLERMPVFARSGAIVPRQRYRSEDTTPPDHLIVDAYPGARGSFRLYEDAGDGLEHARGRFAFTPIAQRRTGGRATLTIGRARGNYSGRPQRRSYDVRVLGLRRPRRVTANGRALRRGAWAYDAATRTLTIRSGARSTNRRLQLTAR